MRGSAMVVMAALTAGCGDAAPAPSDPGPAPVETSGTPGAVRAFVTFRGTIPPPRRIQVLKDVEHFGDLEGTEVQDVLVDPDGGLAGVVLEVHGMAGRGTRTWETPDGGWSVTQQGGRFRPHVMVVPAETDVRFANRDPIVHQAATGAWAHEQPPGSEFAGRFARRTRGFHRVHCNIHSWMEMWMYAAESAYVAVTGPQGRCTIGGLPPGEHTATAAHPTLGRHRVRFTVPPGGSADVTVVFE